MNHLDLTHPPLTGPAYVPEDPDALLTALPTLMGFTPTSAIALLFTAENGELLLAGELEIHPSLALHDDGAPSDAAMALARWADERMDRRLDDFVNALTPLDLARIAAVHTVVITRHQHVDLAAWATTLRALCEEMHWRLASALHSPSLTTGTRWHSLLPGGHHGTITAAPPEHAQAPIHGHPTTASLLEVWLHTLPRDIAPAVISATHEAASRVDTARPRQRLADALERLDDLVATGPRAWTDSDADLLGQLAAALSHPHVHDAVLIYLVSPDAIAAPALWMHLAQHLPGRYTATPLALLALGARLRRQHTLSQLLLGQATAADPDNALVTLAAIPRYDRAMLMMSLAHRSLSARYYLGRPAAPRIRLPGHATS